MQLVIDIPESVKQAFDKATKDDICGGYYDCNGIIGRAIQNGVPLPEEHGRLGDLDERAKAYYEYLDQVKRYIKYANDYPGGRKRGKQ